MEPVTDCRPLQSSTDLKWSEPDLLMSLPSISLLLKKPFFWLVWFCMPHHIYPNCSQFVFYPFEIPSYHITFTVWLMPKVFAAYDLIKYALTTVHAAI